MTLVLINDMLNSWNSVDEQDGQHDISVSNWLLQTFEYQHSIYILALVISIHPQIVKKVKKQKKQKQKKNKKKNYFN